jgi:hypothetical protein
MNFTREELYKQVWAEPVRTVAQRLGVSDVWLRKCCIEADIPLPERGYWAKQGAEQTVVRTKLPPRGLGHADTVQIGPQAYRYGASFNLEAELAKAPPALPAFDEPIEAVRERAMKLAGKLAYQRTLSSPHPLISKILAADDVRKRKQSSDRYGVSWTKPLFDSPFERRRLKVLSSLFVGLARVGGRPWIDDDEARKIGLVVGDARVAFSLDHPEAKPDRDGRCSTRDGFADVLSLTITSTGCVWSDTVEEALEAHLTDIAVEMLVAGEIQLRASLVAAHARALEQRHEMEQRLAERRAEADRQRREAAIKAEQSRQQLLLEMAADHQKARQVRNLVDQVVHSRSQDADQDGAALHWAAWARAIAERIDPVPRLSFSDDGLAKLAEASLPDPDQ